MNLLICNCTCANRAKQLIQRNNVLVKRRAYNTNQKSAICFYQCYSDINTPSVSKSGQCLHLMQRNVAINRNVWECRSAVCLLIHIGHSHSLLILYGSVKLIKGHRQAMSIRNSIVVDQIATSIILESYTEALGNQNIIQQNRPLVFLRNEGQSMHYSRESFKKLVLFCRCRNLRYDLSSIVSKIQQ